MEHLTRVPIKFSDLDMFGHVNHARYLTYCEDSRTEFLAMLGAETGHHLLHDGFVLAHVSCDYLAPLDLTDGAVDVACTVRAVGTSSFTLDYEIRSDDSAAARVTAVLVLTGDEDRARVVGGDVREFLDRYRPAKVHT